MSDKTQRIQKLRAALADRDALIARLQAVVRWQEWAAHPSEEDLYCPRCMAWKTDGHKTGCDIAAVLALTPGTAGAELSALREVAKMLAQRLESHGLSECGLALDARDKAALAKWRATLEKP